MTLHRTKLAFPTISPADIKDCAALVGIQVQGGSECHFLGIAKALLSVRLPSPWKRSHDDFGRVVYLDRRYVFHYVLHAQQQCGNHACKYQFDHALSHGSLLSLIALVVPETADTRTPIMPSCMHGGSSLPYVHKCMAWMPFEAG